MGALRVREALLYLCHPEFLWAWQPAIPPRTPRTPFLVSPHRVVMIFMIRPLSEWQPLFSALLFLRHEGTRCQDPRCSPSSCLRSLQLLLLLRRSWARQTLHWKCADLVKQISKVILLLNQDRIELSRTIDKSIKYSGLCHTPKLSRKRIWSLHFTHSFPTLKIKSRYFSNFIELLKNFCLLLES